MEEVQSPVSKCTDKWIDDPQCGSYSLLIVCRWHHQQQQQTWKLVNSTAVLVHIPSPAHLIGMLRGRWDRRTLWWFIVGASRLATSSGPSCEWWWWWCCCSSWKTKWRVEACKVGIVEQNTTNIKVNFAGHHGCLLHLLLVPSPIWIYTSAISESRYCRWHPMQRRGGKMKGFSRYNKLLMFSRGVCCSCMFLTDIHWARDCNCEADLGRRGGRHIYLFFVRYQPSGRWLW